MRRQSARSTPPLRTYPLQIHPALPPSSATPHLRSEACFVIHTHTHTPFQPIFDPAVHTHPAHLPLPASTSEALASPPSTHSPSFSSRRASRNLKGLAWIMPMTKRAAGVSWLWPSSRPCFEHIFSARACALSRNSVGPARTFEESKSRRKLANRKLVYALKRPRREAQKKSTNYQSRPQKKAQQKPKKRHKLPITTTKKNTKKHKKKHKLPITTTKKAQKKAQTTNRDHKKSTNYQSRPQKKTQKKHKTKSTNYKSRPQKKAQKKAQKRAQTTNHDCTRQNFRRCNLKGKLLSKYG